MPIYVPDFTNIDYDAFVDRLPWLSVTSARQECFMSEGGGVPYTYGSGPGARTYTSIDFDPAVKDIMVAVNAYLADRGWGPMTGCFLNHYAHERQALGWHADDFPGMDHTRPVCVISFGEPREIWWREKGTRGVTPPECRKELGNGSLFIMPPGFQHTHDHRIPKGSRQMGGRVSLTYRAFK